MSKTKRVVVVSAVIVVLLFVAAVFLASPFVKYFVEKNDVKYTGRKIDIGWVYANVFTGFVQFNDVRIYEEGSDTVFLSAKSVSSDFGMLKLLSNTVEMTEIIITEPRGVVINTKKHFNYDDIVVRFTPDPLRKNPSRTHVSVLAVKVIHGEIYYRDKAIPIDYLIRDLNMESSGKKWDADTIASSFSFLSQKGSGTAQGNFMINPNTKNYRFTTSIANFDLEVIRQFIWELINYGYFSAKLNADVRATGNYSSRRLIDMSGRLALNDFHLGKTENEDYLGFEELVVGIDKMNPEGQKFLFDSILLRKPIMKYEKFDSLDNVGRLFGKGASNITDVTTQANRYNLIIEIGRYLRSLTANFYTSQYRVNHLAVTDGDVTFSDYSLSEQFTISANSLNIRADSVDRTHGRVGVRIKSGLKPYGNMAVTLSINPKDSGDFDMFYRFHNVPASLMNPYLLSYTSFPMDRGTMELKGVWNVRNGDIRSYNHLIVMDPRVSKRVKNKDLRWIPLPLLMAFVRERGNVIDYEIPISGNLKNPKFILSDIALDLLKNIFVKPVTIPYGISLRNTENEIENSLNLKWEMGQRKLNASQISFVESLAEFLKKDQSTSIAVYASDYGLKEKEQILFFEAKKKYFLSIHGKQHLTGNDSMTVNKMSVKDPAFMRTLKKGSGAGDTLMFTIQDKCRYYVGKATVNSIYAKLVKDRDTQFRQYFINTGTSSQLTFHSSNNIVPYNGFSAYKIVYKGTVPQSLARAYESMDVLDNRSMRRKYADDLKLSVPSAMRKLRLAKSDSGKVGNNLR
jgi:hypothetical protein